MSAKVVCIECRQPVPARLEEPLRHCSLCGIDPASVEAIQEAAWALGIDLDRGFG